jgi:hypothetical protein
MGALATAVASAPIGTGCDTPSSLIGITPISYGDGITAPNTMHARIKHFASRGRLQHAEILGHNSMNEIEKWQE